MRASAQPGRVEPRWPVILAILGVLLVLTLVPARVRLLPAWTPYALGIALLVPIAGVSLSGGAARWLRVERATTLVFSLLAEVIIFVTLLYLVVAMLNRPEDFSGRQLLTSSIGAWATNVLVFALVDWQIDRGGPEARANGVGTKPDWLFPQMGVPELVTPAWRPTFIDYLFLAYSTATAFSPTDALPLTTRAKLLMMIESSVSLVTIVTVAARAINLLGG